MGRKEDENPSQQQQNDSGIAASNKREATPVVNKEQYTSATTEQSTALSSSKDDLNDVEMKKSPEDTSNRQSKSVPIDTDIEQKDFPVQVEEKVEEHDASLKAPSEVKKEQNQPKNSEKEDTTASVSDFIKTMTEVDDPGATADDEEMQDVESRDIERKDKEGDSVVDNGNKIDADGDKSPRSGEQHENQHQDEKEEELIDQNDQKIKTTHSEVETKQPPQLQRSDRRRSGRISAYTPPPPPPPPKVKDEPKESNKTMVEEVKSYEAKVGGVVERTHVAVAGNAHVMKGTITEHKEPVDRFPERWTVQFNKEFNQDHHHHRRNDQQRADHKEMVIREEEWVAKDMIYSRPGDQSQQNPLALLPLDIIKQRFQEVMEHELESNNMISSLVLMAALENALQSFLLQHSRDASAGGGRSGSTKQHDSPHPPLYYTSNPSVYLQPPSPDDMSSSATVKGSVASVTPHILGQRVRAGCQLAWNYISSKQPRSPPPVVPSANRRSLRQPKPVLMPPVLPEPQPVERGGRVAMWWLEQFRLKVKEKASADKNDESVTNKKTDTTPSPSEATTERMGNNEAAKSTKDTSLPNDNIEDKEGAATGENGECDSEEPTEDNDQEDEKNGDDDYSPKDETEDTGDEELEDVETERESLSPVPTSKMSDREDEVDNDEEDEDDDDEDNVDDIFYNNPYLQPRLVDFLEFLARPKTLSATDIQSSLCECLVNTKHNRRFVEFGLPTSCLLAVDEVALGKEIPDYPKGKVVLKCLSGESFRELKRMDPQSFSRCKFSLEVLGDLEPSRQLQREQEYLIREAEYKKQKAFDKWRFKSVHEGYTRWPYWEDAAAEWVDKQCSSNVVTEGTNKNFEGNSLESVEEDMALAKSLDDAESKGRRRTTRRVGASSSSAEGVFYGNQSKLTQKQLMDALVRLVKANKLNTLMGLQSLVADESSDPIRRTRMALGKLVWKRNQLLRAQVNTEWSDQRLLEHLSKEPLVELQKRPTAENKSIAAAEAAEKEGKVSREEQELVGYLQSLHQTELRLRSLVVRHLAEIPVAIVATAADERANTMESMDSADFEDPTSVEWHASGHELLDTLLYRPSELQATDDRTPCRWFRIRDYSKPIKSVSDDADGSRTDEVPSKASVLEPMCVERRKRFRAIPASPRGVDDPKNVDENEILILTEAQVHAGIKAADIVEQQRRELEEGQSSNEHPFAGSIGSKIALVPVEKSKSLTKDATHGTIVGHDTIVNKDGSVEHRIFFLRDVVPRSVSKQTEEAFWATLDFDASDSDSLLCRGIGDSTLYAIEQFDYHSGSQAVQECRSVLTYLRRQNKAVPFLEPVDPVALNVPDYLDVIKRPMDISTITEKLENGLYFPSHAGGHRDPVSRMLNGPFRQDLVLMFDNAMLFNPPHDWIHQAAAHLKKAVLKKITDLSQAAEQKSNNGRSDRLRQKRRSVYVDEDSDVDMYEYESDKDDDFVEGRQSRKRKRRGCGLQKEDFSSRAVEQPIRLQHTLRDSLGLHGPFSNLPINSEASSFALPPEWSCRRPSLTSPKEDGESPSTHHQERAQEVAELVALQQQFEENEATGLRRSTRAAHDTGSSGGGKQSTKRSSNTLEYFIKGEAHDGKDASSAVASPSNRYEVEIETETRHEEVYSRMYQSFSNSLASCQAFLGLKGSESFGLYFNGSFPPYLGRVVQTNSNSRDTSWEIREPFVVPALRWVIRGLITSGHLSAVEPLSADSSLSSGVILTNDVYYWDGSLQPFEVADLKELQRKKRANIAEDDESEEDIELSEYEKLRAERVARNAERLKALGLA